MPANETCRTVVFADLAGYTAVTDAHGDVSAADVAQRFFDMTESLLSGDARLVKTIGDAVMVVTSEPRQGLQIGLDLLRAVQREPQFPGVRIYRAIAERRGKNKATVAIARKVLTLVYYGLRDGEIRCLARAA
jgi:class 3 adenylate cyclase